MPDELQGKLERAESWIVRGITSILENPSIKTAILGIPEYDSVIYTGLTTLHWELVKHRLETLIGLVYEEAIIVADSKIDESFLNGPEFHDILIRVVEYSAKTEAEQKIRLYARILTRVPLLDNAKYRHRANDFLAILLELTPPDLVLAREIFKQQKDINDEFKNHAENEISAVLKSGYHNLQSITGLDDESFALALMKLNKAGLIRQVVVPPREYTRDAYRITRVFKTMMGLIEKLE